MAAGPTHAGAALAAVLALAACGAPSGAFLCFSDEECTLAGTTGTCEQTGYCSFDDPSCSSGNRYGDYAGDNLSGRCVPGPDDLDAGPDQPDAEPLPLCGSVGDECCPTGKACEGKLICTNGTCGCAQLGEPAIGAYSHHSCTIQSTGGAWCWGSDAQGQIGVGSSGDSYKKPVVVGNLADVTMIAPGATHTCALSAGDVYCWGDNAAGQLAVPGGDRTTPKRIDLSGATWIDSGGATTCAVAAGQVYCWGRNQFGQVGDGTLVDRNKPKLVPGLTGVVAVASGVNMSCALAGDATAWCWGAGDEGELGNGLGTSSLVPVPVTLTDVAQIAAGDDHVCARTGSGTVFCWGDNEFGGIGDGTTTPRPSPTQVSGLANVAEIDVADEYACARKSDGTVWCWGENDVGQLGTGTTSAFESTPQEVLNLSDATGVAAGADHACARRAIGALFCWGSNVDGQLGDDSTAAHANPEPVQLDCP